MKYRVILNTG